MNDFNSQMFVKKKFSKEQVLSYLKNAAHDLEIASKDKFVEVQFAFTYQALIKCSIAYLAFNGQKVRAVPGHHIRMLEKTAELLGDADILVLANAMRMKRNEDLYGDGGFVSDSEASEYLSFVKSVFERVKKEIL